ncbi:MAG: zinc ABC transporter substrate-binding protein, partial [Pseudomonadota bacterium]|nr:zinc ABC transporter substrate-binding protein [Pseudomonadota bacterium]
HVHCVFREPPFEPALVQTVLENSNARRGVLDPIGTDIPPGPDGYFKLMNRLADSLVKCLDQR